MKQTKKSLSLLMGALLCAASASCSFAAGSASDVINQVNQEAASNAAKEANSASNNRGVVEQAAPAPEAVKKVEKTESAAAASTKTTPAAPAKPAADAKASETPAAAPVQTVQTASEELPAGYPKNPSPLKEAPTETDETALVSAEWVKANRSKVILIDARAASLFNSGKGHLPGAVNAEWKYFANMSAPTGSEKYGTIYPPATMAKRIGALGVDGKKPVVIYDGGSGWSECGWVLWIFRQAGIKNAKVMEGGILAWNKIGGEYTKKVTKPKPVSFKISKYVEGYNVDTKWLSDNIGKPNLALIDVRTDLEFAGKIAPFQEKRRGHLPGAINLPLIESFMDANYEFIEDEQLAAMLGKYGITKDTEIVCYDTAGVRSSCAALVLQGHGYLKARNYDPGFQAWAGNKELPLVKP